MQQIPSCFEHFTIAACNWCTVYNCHMHRSAQNRREFDASCSNQLRTSGMLRMSIKHTKNPHEPFRKLFHDGSTMVDKTCNFTFFVSKIPNKPWNWVVVRVWPTETKMVTKGFATRSFPRFVKTLYFFFYAMVLVGLRSWEMYPGKSEITSVCVPFDLRPFLTVAKPKHSCIAKADCTSAAPGSWQHAFGAQHDSKRN